jgi:hypothetical protein
MLQQVTVVDNESLPWVNGGEVFATMEPAFRDNLGDDPELVQALLSKYWMKQLWIDETSRRIDHVRTEPGYIDLSEAYHDSVEEAFFLGGEARLTAEGVFQAGDYFWRPPGWVHMAEAPKGFETILMMEGEDDSEGSGRVSRVVRPDDEAGQNSRPTPNGGVGPRGYVRRVETRFMVWRRHDDAVTGLGVDGGSLSSKLLSLNEKTGARSVLVRLPDGWTSAPAVSDRDRFLVSTSGTLVVEGRALSPCSLVRIPAGAAAPRLDADGDVDLLVKVGAPR